MLLGFVRRRLWRRGFRRLLALTRAQVAIQGDSRLAFAHQETARRMTLVPLPIPDNGTWGLIPKAYREQQEALLRQRFLARLLHTHLLPQLMLGRHRRDLPLSLAVPPTWRDWLSREGFHIAPWRSRFAFWLTQGRFVVAAFVRAGRLLAGVVRFPVAPRDGYTVLLDAPASALPQRSENFDRAGGYARWYLDGPLHRADENSLWLQCPLETGPWRSRGVEIVSEPMPRITTLGPMLAFVFDALRILAMGTGGWLLGVWWSAPLMGEALQLAYVRRLDLKALASTYVFNNSSWILRPLWTHHAAACGSRIIMLFYSSNIQRLPWADGTLSPPFPGYECMTWPEYAVWNDEQRDFLVSLGHDAATYHICGPVDFEDNSGAVPELPENAVIVFDVTPFRPAALAPLGLAPPYNCEITSRTFLEDIRTAAARAGMTMVLKTKRLAGNKVEKTYLRYLETLTSGEDAVPVVPAVNARRVLATGRCAVTLPFSSTALVAEAMGVPSAYYDPTGQVVDRARMYAGSIPVLSGLDNLADWFAQVMKTDASVAIKSVAEGPSTRRKA